MESARALNPVSSKSFCRCLIIGIELTRERALKTNSSNAGYLYLFSDREVHNWSNFNCDEINLKADEDLSLYKEKKRNAKNKASKSLQLESPD